MQKVVSAFLVLLLIAGCSRHAQTDQDLQNDAQQAVDSKLGTEATFSEMESVAAQQIACGHAAAADAPSRGKVDQDFVYLHDRLIMDDEPDFDQAAMECDVAASGGNSTDLENAVND